MEPGEDYDHIEAMKKRLYGRGSGVSQRTRTQLVPHREKIKTTWEEVGGPAKTRKYLGRSFMTKLLVASFIFFLVALVVAGFMVWGGGNTISNRNIDLMIKGPATTRAGDETTFQILIGNRNPVQLEEVKLTIEYPADSLLPNNESKNLRTTEIIGEIKPGGTINKSATVTLFGRENSERIIKATLEYRQPGSNAFFEKGSQVKVVINSPPLELSVKTLAESVTGQNHEFTVEVVSKAETILPNVILRVDYPLGFSFSGANTPPDVDDNIWRFSDLKPADKHIIKIAGMLTGQDEEIKTFTFTTGTEDSLRGGAVKDLYNEKLETVTIKRPFITAHLVVNGKTLPESVVAGGESIPVNIEWVNNLATPVIDGEIEVVINGEVLDQTKISAGEGFYRSTDDTIVWNKNRTSGLREILPGTKGRTSFTFSTLKLTSALASKIVNPTINLSLVIRGTRVSPGFNNEIVESRSAHLVRVQSDLQLAARAIYNTGPFTNTGPLPPKVNTETTYTVVWSISNSSNRVEEAIVKAILSPAVRFLGKVSPSAENVFFDEETGEIVWKVGRIEPSAGSGSGVKEVAWQIGFTPSANQIGKTPDLIDKSILTGRDMFTDTTLRSEKNPLSTRLTSDSLFQSNQATVVQ